MLNVQWRYDPSVLNKLDATILEVVDLGVRKAADDIVADIKDHWSKVAPSDPYNPPAVVTGNLNRNVRLLRTGAGGRFAKSISSTSWTIRVGAEYAAALEYGYSPRNLLPRPFLRPAIKRAQSNLAKYIAAAINGDLASLTSSLMFFTKPIMYIPVGEDEGEG